MLTDSVAMAVETEDIDADLKSLESKLDTSNYPNTHPMFSNKNKKALHCWKNEAGGGYDIDEMTVLRPKVYAYRTVPNKYAPDHAQNQEVKLCKGVKRDAVRHSLTFDMYKSALMEQKKFHTTFHNIRLKANQLRTTQMRKLALSAICNKRYWFNCGRHSVGYGSVEIELFGGECWRCKQNHPPAALQRISEF